MAIVFDTRVFIDAIVPPPMLNVSKSMSGKGDQWIIEDTNNETHQTERITLEFGRIVLAFLNYIKCTHPGENDETIDSIIRTDQLDDKKREMWNQYYNAMVEFIRSKKNKSPEEREDFCKKYQFFAHHLLSNQEFHEYDSLPENARYYPKPVGYYVEKGELYQKWEIRGYQNLFVLDIWELLFNPKAKCSLVQCETCSQFFQTTTKNKHYCAECQQSINYAANYRNNPIHKLRKSILAKIEANKKYSNDEGDELLDRFGREYEYYYQIVNFGKTDLPQPEKYDPNIKTEETFLDWLKKWDDEVRVYNKRAKKNEKNRKPRIIHKFYLRKDYIQKIFNTRREKETEMETDIEDELIR